MTTSKEINCVSEDCIPFTEIVSTTNRGSDSFEDEMDKGNGRTPRAWTSARRYTMWRGRSSNFWVTTLLLLLLLTFLLFVIFLTLWILQNKQSKDAPCFTVECLKTSLSVLSSVDRSISPCDNFYKFACNGFIREHHIPPGDNQISILRLVSKRQDYYMKDLLENASLPKLGPGFAASQIFYNACMNESLIQKRGFAPLYSALTNIYGGWDLIPEGLPGSRRDGGQLLRQFNQRALTMMHMHQLKVYLSTPVFKIGVGQNLENTSQFLIEVTHGPLGMSPENFINDTSPVFEKQAAAYKRAMHSFSRLLGVPADKSAEIDKIYALEKRLAQHMLDRSERDPERYNIVSQLKALKSYCPVFDWTYIFAELFKPLNHTITDEQAFSLSEADFLTARCKIYSEYMQTEEGVRTLHNLAIWHFIWIMKGHLPNEVDRLLREYIEAETGLKTEQERWFKCQEDTVSIFGNILGRYFAKEKHTEKGYETARKMIEEIREAFKENFATVHWMEAEDKRKAIEKVDAMEASLGYPRHRNFTADDEWFISLLKGLNESTYFENDLIAKSAVTLAALNELIIQDKDRWELYPHLVNAFYKETTNHIYFPAGIMQPPVYDPEYPLSINYGGIGMVVGHEITHAFDHQGAKRDAKGNFRQWWSNSTRDAFLQNSQCMIDQYSNFSILNTSLNGKMTLGENIADNGGMKAAYRAFKKLEAKYTDGPKLPGVDFTPDQLFFLSFAHLWCIKALPRAILTTVLYDAHTVDEYRVIGTLMNSEDFARVFNCPVGSYMNPPKKCVVW